MFKKTWVKILLAVLCAIFITSIVCNTIHQYEVAQSLGESVVYNMYEAARAIDLCLLSKNTNTADWLTRASLYLEKAYSQLTSALASSIGIAGRVYYDGNMEFTAQFMLTGGPVGELSIRPASQIDEMNDDEKIFYSKLSEIIKTVAYSEMSVSKSGLFENFDTITKYDLIRIAEKFQNECAKLFGINDR